MSALLDGLPSPDLAEVGLDHFGLLSAEAGLALLGLCLVFDFWLVLLSFGASFWSSGGRTYFGVSGSLGCSVKNIPLLSVTSSRSGVLT